MPNLKMYLYGGAALFYVLSCGVVWYKTKAACETSGRLSGATQAIDTRGKQNEVRNLRPDERSFAGVLHGGAL